MTCHYPNLGSSSDWLKQNRPIRSTTQIWVVTPHQYGISAVVSLTSFREGTNGGVSKCRLFPEACSSRSYILFLYTWLARKRLNFAEMWQEAVVKGMFNIQSADRARKYFLIGKFSTFSRQTSFLELQHPQRGLLLSDEHSQAFSHHCRR